jgi:transcription antitermination factor NusG
MGDADAGPGQEPRWYACYTRARHEKRVADILEERGLEHFLPLVGRWQQWKDRRKHVFFPMFPSYVFARFTLEKAHHVLSVPGVSSLVRVNGVAVPIRDDELDNVRRAAAVLASPVVEVETEPAPWLVDGRRVRVAGGPFAGVQGMVVTRLGHCRVLVGLEQIGQGLEINIDSRYLEPLAE